MQQADDKDSKEVIKPKQVRIKKGPGQLEMYKGTITSQTSLTIY